MILGYDRQWFVKKMNGDGLAIPVYNLLSKTIEKHYRGSRSFLMSDAYMKRMFKINYILKNMEKGITI
jgi:hypothetical protein